MDDDDLRIVGVVDQQAPHAFLPEPGEQPRLLGRSRARKAEWQQRSEARVTRIPSM